MNRALPVLASQAFGGNLLVRGIAGRKLSELLSEPQDALFTLVANQRVAVTGSDGTTALRWLDLAGLAALDLTYNGDEHVVLGGEQPVPAPVYFLGQESGREQGGTLRLAVDVAAAPASWTETVRLQDLRSLMPLLPPQDLAIAGQAMALSQWHQAHLFCSRCGAPSVAVDGGARRQCTAHDAHRHYPRTDPVVIMLVESPDGGSALLGRSKKMRGGMLTCLSGFVDQGEGIEEAVRRETREEAGIEVAAVDIVGSQPWPVGRGGSCELMVGCIARATATSITVDPVEMEEVRWVSKADVGKAVQASASPESPYYSQGSKPGGSPPAAPPAGFFVPPPIAIAHHLLRQWAAHDGPWFGPAPPQQQQQDQRDQQVEQPEPAAVSNL
ncbi:Peroxisomal NADH pyrophosphatase NUDT12 [Chlorella vulgaris]